MNHRTTAVLFSAATIAGVSALLLAACRRRTSANLFTDIRDCLRQGISETRALHRTLRRQRGAINDIHRYLVPVSKGLEKPAR